MSFERIPEGKETEGIPPTDVVLHMRDDVRIRVPLSIMARSKLVSELLQMANGDDAPETAVVLPISEVTSSTMDIVLLWLAQYAASEPSKLPRPLRRPLQEYLTPFEWDFLTTKCLEGGDESRHLNLILVLKAANFLGITELRELCTAMLAHMLKGKDMDQLHTLFQQELQGRRLGPADFEKLYEKFEWMRGSTH
eukprot:PhM_4_TR3196/c0_g1_i1/m.8036/K03094/SKP1, CBF3D; S-phase kinase-associated protein 1